MPLTVQVSSSLFPDSEAGAVSSLFSALTVPVEVGTFGLRRAHYFSKLCGIEDQMIKADMADHTTVENTKEGNFVPH